MKSILFKSYHYTPKKTITFTENNLFKKLKFLLTSLKILFEYHSKNFQINIIPTQQTKMPLKNYHIKNKTNLCKKRTVRL